MKTDFTAFVVLGVIAATFFAASPTAGMQDQITPRSV